MEHYKVVIFGKNLYQEISLQGEYETGVVIGTTRKSMIRFESARFFEDFEIELFFEDNWRVSCSSNIYIESDSILKLYSKELIHGDEVEICYENSKSELFKLLFTIDFDEIVCDYMRVFNIKAATNMTIGGTGYCSVYIDDNLLGQDYITLNRQGDNFLIDDSHTKYGIYINGFKNRDDVAQIQNYDFFMVNGISFYLKDDRLYTDSKINVVKSTLPYVNLDSHASAMSYPKFVKNIRLHKPIPSQSIKILPPEQKEKEKKENFILTLIPTLISFLVMLLLRSAMRGNKMFVVYCAVTMGMGIVTSIVTHIQQKKEHRENTEKRTEEYGAYLKKKEEEIQRLREKEKAALEENYIDAETELMEIKTYDYRLFERTKRDGDYLVIRLGTGKRRAECKIETSEKECISCNDPLAELPELLADSYEYIYEAPIVVDLKNINGIGIVGDKKPLYDMLKIITLDIATRHFFDDVKIYYIFDEADAGQYQNIRWLQNIYVSDAPLRNFVYEEKGKKIQLEYLYRELSRREGMREDELNELPDYVVFISTPEGLSGHPVSKYLHIAGKLGFSFIFFEEHREFVPDSMEKIIFVNDDRTGTLIDADNTEVCAEFEYMEIEDQELENAALTLGCIQVEGISLESKLVKNISLFKLLGIVSVADLDILQLWNNSKVYETLEAPLGVTANGSILKLDLHEKKHGPHGLVAGTTGSGKSEILQTYILSMAALYHPYEVGFVIIDFKGGGMVNQFKDLPHLIGSITNIDGKEIERSLLSIKAELKKRQTIFAEKEVNHIDAYIRLYKQGKAEVPLPHLILIVDEFAELKREQPEFMKELVSAARIGRSLGIHLILATQKPSGVVDEQIWSNSKFRLCLKVQNKNDSNEVLKSPVAAEIREPGRAYLQVGNNEIFELFQSAYSGCSVDEEHMGKQKEYSVYELNLAGMRKQVFEQKNAKKEKAETQLDAMVQHIKKCCDYNHIERLPGICLPSLGECIYDDEAACDFDGEVGVKLGIYDDPSLQLQAPVLLNITQNHTFILGSAQYGKTNILQSVIKQLAMHYKPSEVNIYILDFASKILKNYERLNHVGGVVLLSDEDKLQNFLRMMKNEIQIRKDKLSELGISSFASYLEAEYRELPQIVIIIDNFNALRELFVSKEDEILPLCREGISVGISIICTDIQTNGIGYKYMSSFSKKIALYCNDEGEYASLFGHSRLTNRNIPGRGLVEIDKKIYEFQAFLAFKGEKEMQRVKEIKDFVTEMNNCNKGQRAKCIPEIPDVFTMQYAQDMYPQLMHMPYQVLYGIDFRNAVPEVLDMRKINMLGIIGREGMGQTNFVKNIIESLESNAESAPVDIYIFDDFNRKYISYCNHKCVKVYSCEGDGIISVLEELEQYAMGVKEKMVQNHGKPEASCYKLLVIQNKEAIDVIHKNKACLERYKNIVSQYKGFNIGIIIPGIQNVPVPFAGADVYRMLKDNKQYMIFDDLGNIKVFDIPVSITRLFDRKINAGEGYYYGENAIRKVKFLKIPER